MILLRQKDTLIYWSCFSFGFASDDLSSWLKHFCHYVSFFKPVVFHRSLSDSKSLQIYWTLLSILVVFSSVVVWMVLFFFWSSFQFLQSFFLKKASKALTTIDITVIFMFNYFFSSLARSRYLSSLFTFFIFILWFAGTIKPLVTSYFLLIN